VAIIFRVYKSLCNYLGKGNTAYKKTPKIKYQSLYLGQKGTFPRDIVAVS